MLSLITEGKTYEAHPAFWAPFVLVGDVQWGRWAGPVAQMLRARCVRESIASAMVLSRDNLNVSVNLCHRD
jgi:hypothetical protein